MKKISNQAARSMMVENVRASQRLEQLTPSDFVAKGLNARMSREMITADLLQVVMRHQVTPPRV